MKLNEYRAKRAKDPAYQAAAAKLKLTLNLADRIQDLRIEHGWSQAELGAKLKASAHFVNELERALISPTVMMLENLAAIFGVELEVRLGR